MQEIKLQVYRPISGWKGYLTLISIQEFMLWRRSIAETVGSMYVNLFAMRSAVRLILPQHYGAHQPLHASVPAVEAVNPNATAATVGSMVVNLFAKNSVVELTFPQRRRTHPSFHVSEPELFVAASHLIPGVDIHESHRSSPGDVTRLPLASATSSSALLEGTHLA